MTSRYWKLPVNWREIVDEVRWAARETSLRVRGPATLVVEVVEQEGTGRLLVHLLNYDDARGAAENVEVGVRLPVGKKVAGARLLSPDGGMLGPLGHRLEAGYAVFRVPHVKTYSVMAIGLE